MIQKIITNEADVVLINFDLQTTVIKLDHHNKSTEQFSYSKLENSYNFDQKLFELFRDLIKLKFLKPFGNQSLNGLLTWTESRKPENIKVIITYEKQ